MFENMLNKLKQDNFAYFAVRAENYTVTSNSLNEVVVDAGNMQKMGCKNIKFYKIKNVMGGASFIKTSLADIAREDAQLQCSPIRKNTFEEENEEENIEEQQNTQKVESAKPKAAATVVTADDLEKRLAEVQKRGSNGK